MFKEKKSQSALEFFIIYTFLVLVLTGMFIALHSKIQQEKESLIIDEVSQVGLMVKTYLDLMEIAPDGFKTEVELPPTLMSGDYSIVTHSNGEVDIYFSSYHYVVFKDMVLNGSFRKGKNTLWKYSNSIYINNLCWQQEGAVPC